MYTLYGALGSPYSMKLRAVLRYRRIVHIWRHGVESMQLAGSKVKAPVIPVIRYPDSSYHNDTTPVIYDLEEREDGRSIIPPDPARAFLAYLIEDFADEWLTKAMFGYRWLKEVDQIQMSRWLAFDAMKGGGRKTSEANAEHFRKRQVDRMAIVGCTEENFPLIKATTKAVLDALEAHVTDQHCLFGTRPSLAEFGVYGQLSQLGVDPTAQTMMRADYPYSLRWLLHIDDMSGIEGEWDEADAEMRPVVHAILQQVGRVYTPFLIANAAALQNGNKTFNITVDGMDYTQGVFKYQAKCLADLRRRYGELDEENRAKVDAALADTSCMEMLA
ncbi:MAG: glutathione S-transferase N-terminal domain-containing protein [Pseudomonadota bacterium]